MNKDYLKYFGISAAVIAFDQLTKMLVHHYMGYGLPGQIVLIPDWLKLHYTLNPGMAFGIELGSDYGKLLLTSFRLIAMFGIGYYLVTIVKSKAPVGYIICIALILGGAIGNLFDSVFYGVLLNNSPAGSPSQWFHGQVIDMIYFDLWEGFLPEWLPFFGGQYYAFWPIFNVADATIFCSITTVLIFQGRWFPTESIQKASQVEQGEPKPENK